MNQIKSESEWVMVVDLDELIYSRQEHRTIPDYLRSLSPNRQQIYVPWKLFGSNGHITQPTVMSRVIYQTNSLQSCENQWYDE